ncbi:MAG: hypothetical protein H6815_13060 [Phycisphaeraceae bacterium]|nr:hypothetical protein [Phycisphaerales bacterium]MCB9861371.1 hypothetical protein [Phycisphaeraceae bacterium]
MKAEVLLAELNRLRKDMPEDKADVEWLTLHHIFCFVSYQMGKLQEYLDEQEEAGEFDEYHEEHA